MSYVLYVKSISVYSRGATADVPPIAQLQQPLREGWRLQIGKITPGARIFQSREGDIDYDVFIEM